MKNLDQVFGALAHSAFRRRFELLPAEANYLRDKGLRGHPVFVAQHALAHVLQALRRWLLASSSA